MAKHDEINASSIDILDKAWVIDSIENAKPPAEPTAQIHRVPNILKERIFYEQFFAPKAVSIGPYHYGNEKLEPVERLKPVFTKSLLSKYKVGLDNLYEVLGEANMVQKLRKLYEETSTDFLDDKEFTRMMLLDGCFILYYIGFIHGEKAGSCRELRNHQIYPVYQDLFLLENQIPFEVLNAVMNLIDFQHPGKIRAFCHYNILRRDFGQKSKMLKFVGQHLLHTMHSSLIPTHIPKNTSIMTSLLKKRHRNLSNKYNYRSLKQLSNVGIHFKASSVESLAHVEFVSRWWWFSADVKLPTITVDESSMTMLQNLIAYEMCVDEEALGWVTSYVCFLDSLIDQPEDVAALRKAGILDISYGSDKEIAMMFRRISTDLVPNSLAYSDIKSQIGRHAESWKNTRLTQLMHEYVDWSLLATFGAVMALFLSAVQTVFTVWSPKGDCDDLCMFLKTNHRL